MENFLRVLLLSFILLIITFSISFADDVEVKKWADASAVVNGYAYNTYWLGMTAMVKGREIDFKARKVKGEFKEIYALPLKEVFNAVTSEVTWIACLWERKVENCGCEYCRTQGYHLEGRVECDTDS